jgi:hypothetical protein
MRTLRAAHQVINAQDRIRQQVSIARRSNRRVERPSPPFRQTGASFGVCVSHACSRFRRWRVTRRSRLAVACSPANDRSGSPAPVTFSNSQPFQSRPNPPRAAFPLPFDQSQNRFTDAVLASSDPLRGRGALWLGTVCCGRKHGGGPFGPDIPGMICSSPPSSPTNSFRPCLRNPRGCCLHPLDPARDACRLGRGGRIGLCANGG